MPYYINIEKEGIVLWKAVLDYVKLMDQSKAEIQVAIRELKSEREKLVEKYFR